MEKIPPKIGFVGLSLKLYEIKLSNLMNSLKDFSQELRIVLEKMAQVVHYPLVCDKDGLERAFLELEREKVNGIILVFLSYATSFSLLPVLRKYSFPILIWNTQQIEQISPEFSSEDLLGNHGMHGVQDLCSVLRREEIPFTLITGHFLDRRVQKEVKAWCRATQAAFILSETNIGRIGGTFEDMGDFSVESSILTKELGPKVTEIPFTLFAKASKEVKREDIGHSMEEDKKKFCLDEALKKETHFRSARLELALRKIVKEKNLSALAINFSTFNPSVGVETVPFLGISKLLGEGLRYGGEGDVYSATIVYLLQLLAGKANFVEMFTTDYKNNCILMNHMGESNPQFSWLQ